MRRSRKIDSRQLDLSFKAAEKAGTAPNIQNERISIEENVRGKIIDILRPALTDRENPKLSKKLAFVMYLLEEKSGSDTIALTQAQMIMMKKLNIGIQYRNDGINNIPLDAYDIRVIFPDGIDGGLIVDKGGIPNFVLYKNCKRQDDFKSR